MDGELENPALDTEIEDGEQEKDPQTEVGGAEDSPSGAREGPDSQHEPEIAPRLETEAAAAARMREQYDAEIEGMREQYDAEIEGMGITNPYTGKTFRSFAEFRDYGVRFRQEQLKAEAKKQGKSVEELADEEENKSFLARKRKEEKEQREAMATLKKQKAFLEADLRTFVTKYPNVDPAKLEQNPKFRKFAGKRLYQEPLGELYGDFVELVGDVERTAVEKAAGRRERSSSGGQGGGLELLTPAQRAELEEWNQDNPHMKMTAAQFLK